MKSLQVSNGTACVVELIRQLHELETKVLEYGDEETVIKAFRHSEDHLWNILLRQAQTSIIDSEYTEI